MSEALKNRKGQAPQAFRQSNPRAFQLTQGQAEPTAQLARIDARAGRIMDQARDHYQTHKEPWVAKEAVSLWKDQVRRIGKYPAPDNAVKQISPDDLMKKARQNVEARQTERLSNIQGIKTRMENAVIRNNQSPDQKQSQKPANDPQIKQHFNQRQKQ
ncbi:MAG: hypothetical protein AAGA97_01250 [Pseudomonadota bacterium]